MSEDIKKGLAGVIADSTAVSKVNPETNSLLYRGYPVQELAQTQPFEAVAYLLWNGELPNDEQLAALRETERAHRALAPEVKAVIDGLPLEAHPMDELRTALSAIGASDTAGSASVLDSTGTPEENLERSVRLFAALPAIVAYGQRRRRGEPVVEPRSDLDYSANFLWMTFGEEAHPAVVDAFNRSMILYAEHSFNASTFTARVVTSTTSDYFSAITAAIGALKGSLHGGANEAVMHHMRDIGEPSRAAEWVHARLDAKQKIMGFGHRVYRDGDSRVPTMESAFRDVAAAHDGGRWVELYDAMAEAMIARTGIKPNLDFPAGPTYHLLGFDIPFFTPLFVASRVTGWTAHVVEQTESNALIRPLSAYSGVEQREVKAS